MGSGNNIPEATALGAALRAQVGRPYCGGESGHPVSIGGPQGSDGTFGGARRSPQSPAWRKLKARDSALGWQRPPGASAVSASRGDVTSCHTAALTVPPHANRPPGPRGGWRMSPPPRICMEAGAAPLGPSHPTPRSQVFQVVKKCELPFYSEQITCLAR